MKKIPIVPYKTNTYLPSYKMVKVTFIIMTMYYLTPMIPLYNGFYLFPLSCAINLNRLIFDPGRNSPIVSVNESLKSLFYRTTYQ